MHRIACCSLVAALVASSALPRAIAADPPDKAACARSYEKGQRLRAAHELRAARSEMLVCSRKECPALLKNECVPWLGELEAAIPSVVVVPKTTDGSPPPRARLTVDGAVVADPVGEGAIELDPGDHVLVLDAGGSSRTEQRVTLRESERDRRIEMSLPPLPAPERHDDAPTSADEPRTHDEAAPAATERPIPALVWVVGGAGIVGAGLGAYFQSAGTADRNGLTSCAPNCRQSDVDDARTKQWVGNIALTVGALAIIGAVVLFVTRPTVPASTVSAR